MFCNHKKNIYLCIVKIIDNEKYGLRHKETKRNCSTHNACWQFCMAVWITCKRRRKKRF